MARCTNEGDVITADGRKNCFDHTCEQDHEYVDEGRFTWRPHTVNDPDFGEVVEYELTHSFTNPGDGCIHPCEECD